MRKLIAATLIGIGLAGPVLAQPAAPPPAPDRARIYFYRPVSGVATPIWTAVYLNGQQVGDSGPGLYFFRDVPPGSYEITLRSQGLYPGQFQTATVRAGDTVYVRVSSINYFGLSGGGVSFNGGGAFMSGGSLYSEPTFADQIMDPVQARREMAGLSPAE